MHSTKPRVPTHYLQTNDITLHGTDGPVCRHVANTNHKNCQKQSYVLESKERNMDQVQNTERGIQLTQARTEQ